MKKKIVILLICLAPSFVYSQCTNADNLHTSNITHANALAEWKTAPIADRYHIHYREIGGSWNNLANISGIDTTRNIPGLNPLTTYEWQIKTFCDTSNQPNSGWSYSDTFATPAFFAAPFNPIISKVLGSLECNVQTQLYLKVSQDANEPDIETSTITTDGGYFNLNSISFGDSVGYATLTHANQSIITVLRVAIIAQNYAIINSYDSLGLLMGFFSIENTSGGIKIETAPADDGNDYTSGYVSELYFTNLFVNPENAGPLHFYSDIESELNDQIYQIDTAEIWCNTTETIDLANPKEILIVYDILGKKTKLEKNTIQLIKFSNGRIKKHILLEE